MSEIKIIERPEGQREDYLFVEADGQRYKALHELRHTDKAQPALVISLAPVGADGHALRVGEGVPDVTWHTHTFTETELADPAFDMEARVAIILRALVERKARELASRARVGGLSDRWLRGDILLGGKQ